MASATSPFLNQPLRTEQQASTEIAWRRAEQATAERTRCLPDHAAVFGRRILDGAFERVYEPDGSYRLHAAGPAGSGEDVGRKAALTDALPVVGSDGLADGQPRHSGYCAALHDISCWIAAIAMEPRMDPVTLTALNMEIERLSRQV